MRNYHNESDYWRIRDFLRQVFLLNNRRMLSWPVARLDYWSWHGILNMGHNQLEKDVFLWETEAGEIAAVLNPEGPGQAFLQVHPAWETEGLQEEMISQAETCLRVPGRGGGSLLCIWCAAEDSQLQAILQQRGYSHLPAADEFHWRRDLSVPIPNAPLPHGYGLRPLVEAAELPARSWASWRAFHPDEPIEGFNPNPAWYRNIQAAPLYRRERDLVAIVSGGEIAAFTTIWYEPATRCGYFEPVGTVPEHQRRGLARALLCEGLRELKNLGADQALVIGGESAANALYRSVLGPVYDICQPWEKR